MLMKFKMYIVSNVYSGFLFIYLFGLLYQVFVMPLFDYCNVIWSPMMNQLKIMERLHSKVMSSVCQREVFLMFRLHIVGT